MTTGSIARAARGRRWRRGPWAIRIELRWRAAATPRRNRFDSFGSDRPRSGLLDPQRPDRPVQPAGVEKGAAVLRWQPAATETNAPPRDRRVRPWGTRQGHP